MAKRLSIEELILVVRNQKVMLDRDLAALYGVTTKALVQAYKRNRERFPDGFAFHLSKEEQGMLIERFPRLSPLKHSSQTPLVFTDYGIAMLSSVLRSERAIRINIRVIQAFVRMKRLAVLDGDLRQAVVALQARVGEHDEAIQRLLDVLEALPLSTDPRPVLGFQPDEQL